MGKVPEYTRRAIEKYRKKQYYMQIRFSKEEKEMLDSVGLTSSECANLIRDELARRLK